MDLNKSLKKLFVSRARVSLLNLFYGHPQDSFYIREVVRLTGEEINSVRREMINLENAGVLKSERRGNRLFYFLDKTFIGYHDLLSIIAKTQGLGSRIIKNKSRLGDLKFVIFSGNFLRWEDDKSQVDFLIIGRIVLPEIGKLVVEEEKIRGREINYAVMDIKEFKLRKINRDPFLLGILLNNPVVIFGDPQDLAKA